MTDYFDYGVYEKEPATNSDSLKTFSLLENFDNKIGNYWCSLSFPL